MTHERVKEYNDKNFKKALGIPRKLFELFLGILIAFQKEKHKKGGRKPKL